MKKNLLLLKWLADNSRRFEPVTYQDRSHWLDHGQNKIITHRELFEIFEEETQ